MKVFRSSKTAVVLAVAAVTSLAVPANAITSKTTWQNTPFSTQGGTFTVTFDAAASAVNMDGVVGLSAAAVSRYNSCAVLVRFNSSGAIDARKGGSYAAATSIQYAAGKSYRFRLAVDVTAHTYSVYVTPAGGAEVTLGNDYAFRTEQATVSSLGNWALIADPGVLTVTNFAAGPAGTLAVSAGSDMAVALPAAASLNGTATYNGSATLPAGTTLAWTKVSGSGTVTFSAPAALSTTATFSPGGTYTLQLAGTYNGQTVSDQVVVHAAPALTIQATPTSGSAPLSVQFNALESGVPASHLPTGSTLKWTFGDGSSASGVQAGHTYSSTGTFTASLALTQPNGLGTVNYGQTTITVSSSGYGGMTSTATWQNMAFAAQTGNFTAEFDAVPNAANMDGVTALAAAPASAYSGCAVLVRFNSTGTIDVRNGSNYGADVSIVYTAGKSYHFRVEVEIPAHTYSVYVTPAGGAEQTLAYDYAFRTEQASASSLSSCAMIAEPGTHTVSSFRVSAAAQLPLTASAGLDTTIIAGQSTMLSASAGGGTPPYTYSWSPTTGLSNATSSNPTASPTATTTYTVTVRDAAGATATDTVIVTVNPVGSGPTYYVSPSGNDGNAGTASAPWRTLAKAANTATAGSTVIVKAGTYNESLNPANSGQSGKSITFKSETVRGAIIDGQKSRGTGVDLGGKPYIRIEGFDIRNHTSAGMSLQDYAQSSSVGVQVVNNYVHLTGDSSGWQGGGFGIQASNVRDCLIEGNEITMNGDTAIRTGGSGYQTANLTIRGNDIHYNGRDGISGGGTNVIVEYNFMHDQCHSSLHSDGVELSMANGFVFRYNTIGDFTQLVYGGPNEGEPQPIANIQVYGNIFYDSLYWSRKQGTCPAFFIDCRRTNMGNNFSNHYVYSNTFLYLGDGQKAVILYGAPGLKMNDVRIFNNIFYQCRGTGGGYAYDIDSRFTNVVSDYNCFYNTEPVSGKDAHSIFVNPKMVNYTQGALNFDAHLQASSPCVNTGPANLGSLVPLPSPYVDIDGKTRPQGGNYDIGAYEQ